MKCLLSFRRFSKIGSECFQCFCYLDSWLFCEWTSLLCMLSNSHIDSISHYKWKTPHSKLICMRQMGKENDLCLFYEKLLSFSSSTYYSHARSLANLWKQFQVYLHAHPMFERLSVMAMLNIYFLKSHGLIKCFIYW